MQALSFGLGIFAIAIAGWVYFDATDRGIPFAWLWALGTLVLLPVLVGFLLLLVYFLIRGSSRRLEVADGAPLRLYLADATFSALVLAVSGAATAMAAALAYAVSDTVTSNDFRDTTASAISALVVGSLVWWPHWRALTRQVTALKDDGQFRAMFALRRTEVLTATFLFGVVAATSALVLIGGAITALFRTTYGAAVGWLPALGVVLACGAAAWYHGQVYRDEAAGPLGERYAAIPAPTRKTVPAPALAQVGYPPAARPPQVPAQVPRQGPPPASGPVTFAPPAQPVPTGAFPAPTPAPGPAPVFCVRCGTQGSAQDEFCRQCGARLTRPAPTTPGPSYRDEHHR